MERNSSLSGYIGENVVAIFAVSFCYLIFFILGSKQGYIIFRISLLFIQIRPQILEVATLERRVYNVRNVVFDNAFVFQRIFFVLADNRDNNNILDKFTFLA